MQFVDAHLDLAYLAVNGRDVLADEVDPAAGCVSLPRLRRGGVELAFGTIFTEAGVNPETHPHGYRDADDAATAELAGIAQLEVYEQWEAMGEIAIVRTAEDLEKQTDRLKIVILMEGADPIVSPARASWWFDRGVRAVGLTWAMGSRYAGGNGAHGPLTGLGRDLVSALDELGVIHDVSHLADAALDDLLNCAKGPIVATHSNARALLKPIQRHLTDEQIRRLAARNAMIGLNLFGAFLASDRRATIADCIAQVQHITTVMGHRHGIGLGSDMDGGFAPERLPENIERPEELSRLTDALRIEAGWNETDVTAFAHENWLRFMEQALPRA